MQAQVTRAWCPHCDQLVEIYPSEPIADNWSARWWKFVLHAKDGKICDRSGTRT